MSFLAGFAAGAVFVIAAAICAACWTVNRVLKRLV